MEKVNVKYFKVTAKCGHVGKGKYIPITFAICAENGKEAAAFARLLPRVKHDHKDAILNCEMVSYAEYYEILEKNNNDPYLHCKNRRDQKTTCNLSDRLVDDDHSVIHKHDPVERLARIKYKNIKMYYRFEVSDRNELYA